MKKRCAVFTVAHNEKHFLPLWLKYYSQFFGMGNLYVLDHESTDGSTRNLECNVKVVRNDTLCDADWLLAVLKSEQKSLLNDYECVIRPDADEFIIPDPNKYKGLSHYIDYMRENSIDTICCFGHEVIHKRYEELSLDWDRPILVNQREYWINISDYDKPIIALRPVNWSLGGHCEIGVANKRDADLLLVHLHKVDFETCKQFALYRRSRKCSAKYAPYQLYTGDKFEKYFDNPQNYLKNLSDPNCQLGTVSKIPDRYKGIL